MKPMFTDDWTTIYHGDCLTVMADMDAESIDSIVTDPPYGLSFMGREWDHGVPGEAFWAEALRVAKPGAHMVAFGGTRTYHRLAVAIEDAGWEVRDCLGWLYGSGFPKSHNLDGEWQGWGTALKPAWEPCILARRPLTGTVASNVQRYGTGALNIDGCRVGTEQHTYRARGMKSLVDQHAASDRPYTAGLPNRNEPEVTAAGRWPANIVHDGSDEVLAVFPRSKAGAETAARGTGGIWSSVSNTPCGPQYADDGSAARFFYCAKADKRERDEGIIDARNIHPTVKPLDLMRWLVRLVTPPDGVVLDPFMGSGTTLKAARAEGHRSIGIDLEREHCEIAWGRLSQGVLL